MKSVALGRHQCVTLDVEAIPVRRVQVLAAGKQPKQLVGRIRQTSPGSFPVLDRAHADTEQLGARDVAQSQAIAVGAEAFSAFQTVQKLPVRALWVPILDFA